MRPAALVFVLMLVAGCELFESRPPDLGPPADADRHTYVISDLRLPANAADAVAFGLDLDGKPNDGIDNQLGMLLGSLGALAPELAVTTGVERAVDRGELILLVDVRALDLVNASRTGTRLVIGADPQPPACLDDADLVCRRHLDGLGSFELAATALPGEPLPGNIVDARLLAGPGDFPLPIVIGSSAVVNLPLRAGRVDLAIEESRLGAGSRIGGAITPDDFLELIVPRIQENLTAVIARDCPPPGAPPRCNCRPGTSGEQLLGLFDRQPVDCAINDAEVERVVGGFLTPDLDLDDDGVTDAISIGVGVQAAAAAFPEP